MLYIFNTFTSKYFHFAHVILTMLSSTYHFWGVHNLHQAKSAKLNIGEQSKVGLFFFFLFSHFVFHLSFFVIRFSLSVIRFRYSFFTFGLSPFVSAFRFFFSFFIFLTFKIGTSIVFWHSNWGRIYYFNIQNPILTFKLGPNIEFWYSKSYFEIQNRAEKRILTFKILFWHSSWDWILRLTFKILFWHSQPGRIHILTFKIPFRHSNWGRISNFDIKNPILIFEIRLNIEFWHSKSYFDIWTGAEYRSWHSKSYFDIRIEVEYRISTFKILFWHWKRGRISHFDIPFKILFSHSNWGWISYCNIHNPFLTFELGPNIVIWHSKSYFHIRNRAEYRILKF